MGLFKRFNIVYLLVLIGLFASCEKRERLTYSTFPFRISPSAKALLPTETVTLTAQGGNVNTEWSVSASSVGTIAPTVGATVVFTAVALGDARITATVNGAEARAQVAVVNYIPDPNDNSVFNVYNDAGLPPAPTFNSDIDLNGLTLTEMMEYPPEGSKFLQALSTGTGGFWGVTLDDGGSTITVDLTAFTALRFWIRLNEDVSGNALRVEFKDNSVPPRTRTSLSGSVNWTGLGFDPTLTGEWQEVRILRAAFGGDVTTVQSSIEVPFNIVQNNLNGGQNLTFDIDAVRWE